MRGYFPGVTSVQHTLFSPHLFRTARVDSILLASFSSHSKRIRISTGQPFCVGLVQSFVILMDNTAKTCLKSHVRNEGTFVSLQKLMSQVFLLPFYASQLHQGNYFCSLWKKLPLLIILRHILLSTKRGKECFAKMKVLTTCSSVRVISRHALGSVHNGVHSTSCLLSCGPVLKYKTHTEKEEAS